MKPDCAALSEREFGILLHIPSLPGTGNCGDLGGEAYRFVDFLAASGARVWQVLPLVPTHACGSPYNGQSTHAGNPAFISMQQLFDDGFVCGDDLDIYAKQNSHGDARAAARAALLEKAYRQPPPACPWDRDQLARFEHDNRSWLLDYALYVILKRVHNGDPWYRWSAPLRDRNARALTQARRELGAQIELVVFEQYLFWRQWQKLKAYANGKGIRIMGDAPIFPAHDSAEVWAHRGYFQLDDTGAVQRVAGVPPDYFSTTGQRWGNPLYEWRSLAEHGFDWWIDRIRRQLDYFDLLRLDHFRGFESYWSIPASSVDATQGHWQTAPGDALFDALARACGPLPLIAEDLGLITAAVTELRRRIGLPGMRVLQFAFDGNADNLHLPHNHEICGVVFTGTHDNHTTLGWFHSLDAAAQERVYGYLGMPAEPMPWALIRAAVASVARLAIVPMQDAMVLDDAARMNLPGSEDGNWSWRFAWSDIPEGTVDRLRHLATVYGRI